jgi:hypothetical protein
LDENGVIGNPPDEPANCDDQNHSITVTVPGAFTPGTASGQASVLNATFTSIGENVGSEVKIK